MHQTLMTKGRGTLWTPTSILRPPIDTARAPLPPESPRASIQSVPPTRPKKPKPEKGSDDAKEQMRAVREAQMHRYLSNHPIPEFREDYARRERSLSFADSTKDHAP